MRRPSIRRPSEQRLSSSLRISCRLNEHSDEQEELQEKLARQCELNAQLDLENAKSVDADLGGLEEEEKAETMGVAERDTPYLSDNNRLR